MSANYITDRLFQSNEKERKRKEPFLQNRKQFDGESITKTTKSKLRQQPKLLSKANSHRYNSSPNGCICEFCRLKLWGKYKKKTKFSLEAPNNLKF